jgi:hypothetical protein
MQSALFFLLQYSFIGQVFWNVTDESRFAAQNYSSNDWTEYHQHVQAAGLVFEEHLDLILATPIGVSLQMMRSLYVCWTSAEWLPADAYLLHPAISKNDLGYWRRY